jgi:hypothetical protein
VIITHTNYFKESKIMKNVVIDMKSVIIILMTFLNVNILFASSLESKSTKVLTGIVREFSEEAKENSVLKTAAYLKFPVKTKDSLGNWVDWVIQPGIFVKEGTIIARSDPDYTTASFKILKNQEKIQRLILKEAKKHRERCVKLTKTGGVISEKEKEDADITYYNALKEHESVRLDLELVRRNMKYLDLKAPYDCYIDKVYARPGALSDEDYPVLKMLRLSPLYIDIKIDRSTAKKILRREIGISVYPMDSFKPVGIYNDKVIMTPDGILMPVRNYMLDETENYNLPIVNNLEYVVPYNAIDYRKEKTSIAVFENSVHYDEKGDYVWKADGQKAAQPGIFKDSEFTLTKVYIEKTGQKKTSIDGYLLEIEKNKKLKANDVLAKTIPEGLKPGDKVKYVKKTCLFWPDDEVKVELHFYS